MPNPCKFCDESGSKKTYGHQACMPIDGRVQNIDWCIHHIVAALNAGGIRTVASCCGHKTQRGVICLEDGRALIIHPDTDDLTPLLSLCDTPASKNYNP